MFPIGFVGTRNDIEARYKFYEQSLGQGDENNFIVVPVLEGILVELQPIINNCQLVIVGSEVSLSQDVVLPILRNVNYIFFDFLQSIPLNLLANYKKYQVEASNNIAFNVSPYLSLKNEILKKESTFEHLQLTSITNNPDFSNRLFSHLIFLAGMFHDLQIKYKFHLLQNIESNVTTVVTDAFNLQGKYIHLTIGQNETVINECTVFDSEMVYQNKFCDDNLYTQTAIMISQIDALFSKHVIGDLDIAILVAQLLEKLKSVAEKRGISINSL